MSRAGDVDSGDTMCGRVVGDPEVKQTLLSPAPLMKNRHFMSVRACIPGSGLITINCKSLRNSRCARLRLDSIHRNQILHNQRLIGLRDRGAVGIHHLLDLFLPHGLGEARLHRDIKQRMAEEAVFAIQVHVRPVGNVGVYCGRTMLYTWLESALAASFVAPVVGCCERAASKIIIPVATVANP